MKKLETFIAISIFSFLQLSCENSFQANIATQQNVSSQNQGSIQQTSKQVVAQKQIDQVSLDSIQSVLEKANKLILDALDTPFADANFSTISEWHELWNQVVGSAQSLNELKNCPDDFRNAYLDFFEGFELIVDDYKDEIKELPSNMLYDAILAFARFFGRSNQGARYVDQSDAYMKRLKDDFRVLYSELNKVSWSYGFDAKKYIPVSF